MRNWAIRECAILGVIASGLFGCSAAEPTSEEAVEDVAAESSALPRSIASALDGVMLTAPCRQPTGEANVCVTIAPGTPCPLANPDRALSGALLTDKVVTLGGSANRTYTITLRIQGVVEAKQYIGSTDSNRTATSPAANGFAVGGTPTTADAYGVYMIRTSNPPQSYYLNSLVPPGVSDHTTYGVDYTARITARGGSTIRLVAADPNCAEIKNCGPVNHPGQCTAPITLVPNARARAANPTFNFNTAYNGQWLVMTVSSVD